MILDDASEESTVRQSRSRLARRRRAPRRTRRDRHQRGRRRPGPLRRPARHRPVRGDVPGGRPRLRGRAPRADSLPDMSAEGGTRAVVAALLANTGIALTKFVAFLLTGASSMLAEAIHSVADSGNQGLLLLGGRQAEEGRDAGAPVRLRPRALHLLVPGRDRAVQRRRPVRALRGVPQVPRGPRGPRPPRGLAPRLALVVGAARGAAWSRSGWRASPSAPRSWRPSKIKGDATFVQFIRRAKQPELPVILLEDFAALIGLGVRADRGRDEPAHRLALLGRRRHRPDRAAPGGGGDRARHRDQEPAARRGRVAAGAGSGSARRSSGPTASTASIHMRTMHLGPEELLVAVKVARARRRRPPPTSRRRSTAPRRPSARRSRPPA